MHIADDILISQLIVIWQCSLEENKTYFVIYISNSFQAMINMY